MSNYKPLEEFLQAEFSQEKTLALTPDKEHLSAAQWFQRFRYWHQFFSTQRNESWALFEQDCFEFSAILFALWATNKKVYLASNSQPEYLIQLSGHTTHFVGSFNKVPDNVTHINSFQGQADQTLNVCDYSPARLTSDVDCLYIFTSGSTGEPQAITKNLNQISTELDTLHRYWSSQDTHRHIVASVSHQHIYGLLFRCLWPLLEGWSFDTHARQYTEELVAPKNVDSFLVSSPTHLTRLPKSSTAHTKFDRIFSSGAPLDRELSLQAKSYFGTPITEILGSSETGGIAWKEQQDLHETTWTCFDCIDFKISPVDGTLIIRSPYLRSSSEWFKTSDCATATEDNKFYLQGRADRIVKVEGKRISLDEMENTLKRHPLVIDARLGSLSDIGGRIGAAICVQEPSYQITRQRRQELSSLLRTFLLQQFERAALPKKWRFLNHLPKNSQGKISSQDMKKIFEQASQRPTSAQTLSSQASENQLFMELKVPENLRYFDGHFDQAAILPGVVQIQWAEEYARSHFNISQPFLRLEVLKFQKVVTPGSNIKLSLTNTPENNKISFKYTSSAGQHASGRIVFG